MRRLNPRLATGLAIGGVALVLGGQWLHGYQMRRTATVLLKRAADAEQAGDLRGGAKFYELYLRQHPDDAKARQSLAEAALKISGEPDATPADYDRAYWALHQAVEANASQQALRLRLAQFLLRPPAPKYQEAAAQLELLWNADRNAEIGRQLSACYAALGREDDLLSLSLAAIGYDPQRNGFDTARAIDFENVRTYVESAEILRRRGKVDLADRVMEQMAAANPDSFAARLRRAQWLLQRGAPTAVERKLADADIALARRLRPNDPALILAEAALATAQRDYAAAERQLQRGVRLYPEHAGLQSELALTALNRGRPAAAQQHLERALRGLPGNVLLLALLTEARVRQGDFAGARRTVADLRDAGPALETLAELEARIAELEKLATESTLEK